LISSLQKFGDKTWTQDKLERVRKYLAAYSRIMRKQRFLYAYIDGFAGTGYHELEHKDEEGLALFAASFAFCPTASTLRRALSRAAFASSDVA
jgi:three-Cys-motif partner protein